MMRNEGRARVEGLRCRGFSLVGWNGEREGEKTGYNSNTGMSIALRDSICSRLKVEERIRSMDGRAGLDQEESKQIR